MADKFEYLFDQGAGQTQDLRSSAADSWKQEKKGTIAEYKRYKAHITKDSERTLLEGLEELGMHETNSARGYKALFIGTDEEFKRYQNYLEDPTSEKARTSLAENTKAAINAILSVASRKYQILDVNYHLSWFDPRTDAPGVVTVWDASQKTWVVYDWENGAYTPSTRIVPRTGKTATNGNNQYKYQAAKHEAIRDWLVAKELKTNFLAVMTFEDQASHYQEKIRDRNECDLGEVWALINQDWNDAAIKKQLISGSTQPKAVKVSEEREAFLAELAELDENHVVYFTSANSSNEMTILFPADDPVAKADALKRFRNTNKTVVYDRFEKVEEES